MDATQDLKHDKSALPSPESVPVELRGLRQWVIWKPVPDPQRHGKFRKPPRSAKTGEGIGAVDKYESEFVTYDAAVAAAPSHGCEGVGLVFRKEDPYVFIDFDNCYNDGKLEPAVEMWLPWLSSFTEFSPSGTGIHIIGRGRIANALVATALPDGNGATVEIYDHSRYATVTGRSFPNAPREINDISPTALARLFEHLKVVPSVPGREPEGDERPMSVASVRRIHTANLKSLRNAPQGAGNPTLNSVAFFAGRAFASKALEKTEEQIKEELLQIVCHEWSQPHPRHGAEATIASGWNSGVRRPLKIGFRDKVFGDDRHALLEEHAETYYRQQSMEELGEHGEGILFLELRGVNSARCYPPLTRSSLRRLCVKTFEQVSGLRALVHPGMFEDDEQNTTDAGYGKHFIREHGGFVRYNTETGEWLVYSKGVWHVAHDDVAVGRYFKEQFIRREKQALLSIASLADEVEQINLRMKDKDHQSSDAEQNILELFAEAMADLKAARNGQESRNINSALEQARTEVGVDLVNKDFDADPLLFNALNMAIDLRSSNEVVGRVDQFFLCQSPFIISDDAGCPRFEQILARSLPDAPTREYLQDFFGLCLSGLMSPDILIFLGDGANGKSLIRNIVAGVLGDYHAKASMSTFLVSKNINPGGARTDLAGFRGKRLITASEANRKVMLDMELLKDWTGNEDVNARDLWQKGKNAQFSPQGKILLLMNHAPRIIDQSEGTWRRLKYVRFDVIIPASERNDKLGAEVLETEGAGVLDWMMKGWERVRARLDADAPCLVTPAKIADDTTGHKEKESVVARFFEEQLEAREGWKTLSADVYECYAAWCKRNNEYQESSTELALAIQRYCSEHGITLTSRAKIGNARGFIGLKLKCEAF